MTDEKLIRQIEAALERLKTGDESAREQLTELFSQLKIELRDINESTGVAIGQNIRQIIIQQGYTPEQVIQTIQAAIRAEQPDTLLKLPEIPGRDRRHVFISYARVDGSAYAEQLYKDLDAHDYAAWRDTRNLTGDRDFSAEIEQAIEHASHVVVIVTPDVKRETSFVRLEIAYALNIGVPVIPLLFEGGHRPITIINHTYVDFREPWEEALTHLLNRLSDPDDITTVTPVTRRDREIAYLESVSQQRIFTRWREVYTDIAAETQTHENPVELTPAAQAFFGMDLEHDIFEEMVHEMHPEAARTVKVEKFNDLREAIWQKRRVALIGDPGAGKTTTLERLADELAARAVDDPSEPLPLFVRLGSYNGGRLDGFLQETFGGLPLEDYLVQERVFLLLDGLNEMRPDYRGEVDSWLRANPDVPVVVSCRTLDYVGLKLPLQRVDVLPLDIDRQYAFIGNFFANETDRETLFWGLAGMENREAWEWFKSENDRPTLHDFWHNPPEEKYSTWKADYVEQHRVQDLRSELGEYTPNHLPRDLYGMLGITSNPFLLSITVRLYTTSGRPPANRGQLFEGFVQMLFEKRGKPAAAVRGPWVDIAVQRKALAALAYRMQAENTGTSVEQSWAIQTFSEALPDYDPEHLLYLAASASILEVGSRVRFTHQLIQEYFAAFQMGEDLRVGISAEKYWPGSRWWEQTGWEETAVLLAGITRNEIGELDATPVVEWLARVQPHLAYRCATESGAECADYALQALYQAEPPQRIATLAKVRWGHILAEQGDIRPGVGVKNGLPDIEWLPVEGTDAFEMKDHNNEFIGTFSVPDFAIARYPITCLQFQAFIVDPEGFDNPEWWKSLYKQEAKPGSQRFKYDNHPRDTVSWFDAVAFCRWLSDRLGEEIRLPTEWEWQWAALGDTGRVYPWGYEYIPGYANIDEVSGGVGPYYLRETTPVGMYLQGAALCGALDMSGNVWEWCLNEYANPENINVIDNTACVVRGGSWSLGQDFARATGRLRLVPSSRSNFVGFRVVRGPYPEQAK